MSSSKSLSDETLQFHKQNSVGYYNHHDKNYLKEKSIVGTFQGEPSRLSYGRYSLEASAGNVYDASNDRSSFGGSFGHANVDEIFGGGKFRTHGFDDTQVVPDFDELLETIHVDKKPSLVAESEYCSSQVRYDSFGHPERSKSESDELEIYFPCELTPLPLDRLYSTLADDATVFKFPESSDEFFATDKSKADLSLSKRVGTHDFIAEDNCHSLDSFHNVSIFSFSTVSEPQFDESGVTSPEATVSTKERERGLTEEQHQFLDSGQQCVTEQQILSLSTMTIGNKRKFQESVTTAPCAEAIGLSVLDRSTSREKQCENPWQSSTVYDLPVQLSNTLTSGEHLELSQNLTVNKNLSLNLFSLNEWRNCSSFNAFVENSSFKERGCSEGEETSVEPSRLEYLSLPPTVSSIKNTPKYLCEKETVRGKESSRCANLDMTKTETDQQGSDEEYSTKFVNKRSKIHKLKPGWNELGNSYNGNSRGFHNNLEKQRRINMKARFQHLRMALPDLSDNQRASKIAILRKAFECIGILEKECEDLEYIKRTEKLKNIELLNKLQDITSGQS